MSRSKSTAELARIRICVTRPSHFITFLSLLNMYRGGGGARTPFLPEGSIPTDKSVPSWPNKNPRDALYTSSQIYPSSADLHQCRRQTGESRSQTESAKAAAAAAGGGGGARAQLGCRGHLLAQRSPRHLPPLYSTICTYLPSHHRQPD